MDRNNILKKQSKLKEENSDLLIIVGLLAISFFIVFFFLVMTNDTKFQFDRDRDEVGPLEVLYKKINNSLNLDNNNGNCINYIEPNNNNLNRPRTCKKINEDYSKQSIDDLD